MLRKSAFFDFFESLCRRFGLGEVTFTECTDAWAGVALQGPYTAAVLNNMGIDNIAELFETEDVDAASVGIINCSNWSWGMNTTIGNASIKSELGDLDEAWCALGSKRVKVALSRGPLINLERRNQVPAPVAP